LRRGDAVVRESLQVIDEVLARVSVGADGIGFDDLPAKMGMRVDDRGNDRLTGQIDARRSGRELQFAFLANLRNFVVLDQKRGVLDRRAIAGDEPGAFKQDRALLGDCSR
jgi:hypothetical protein